MKRDAEGFNTGAARTQVKLLASTSSCASDLKLSVDKIASSEWYSQNGEAMINIMTPDAFTSSHLAHHIFVISSSLAGGVSSEPGSY